jgi:predicted regulator of Ras-like GTPase activity (Roadblock/LC7/MglB family)
MLAFLKTIFRGRTAAPQGAAGLAIPRTVYTPGNTGFARRAAPRASARPASAPVPEPVPATPESDTNGAVGSDIDIPLQSVLRGLPHDLQDRVRDLDIRGATMSISLERILAQLPSGAVKISFGSLRHAAPQLFSPGADCDSRDVALPLDEIMAKINPAMICPPQEKADRGSVEMQESVASAAIAPERTRLESPPRGASLSVPPMAAPGENAKEFESAARTEQNVPTPPRPAGSKPAAKAPPIRVPTPQVAKPATAGSVSVKLASLSDSWPLALREEIAQWNLPEANVALPAEQVREAMKFGRVAFPWKTLRAWITPSPPAVKSVDENAILELPLAVITPLFITGKKQPTKSPQTAGMAEIPDLFFDGRKPESLHSGNHFEAKQHTPISVPQPVATAEPAVAAEAPAITAEAPAMATVPAVPEPAQPTSEQGVMRIPLRNLTELWPEKVRTEVAQWNLEQLMVSLPAEKINAALKQGKVVFSWKNLRSWIVPPPPSTTLLRDEALLELPLPMIMPVFLAGQKQQIKSAPKSTPVIDDDIPDPFADFLPPKAATGASVAQETLVAPAADEKATRTDSKEKSAKGKSAKEKKTKEKGKAVAEPTHVEKIAEAQPLKREETPAPAKSPAKVQPQAEKASSPSSTTPSEVLASAMGLEGVAGALVALSDGFKVASKLPPGLDGDALAAFLPHIFSKVDQSARELRMGDLTNLNFTVDNIPWKIFRVNQIFFAALGRAGQTMPTDQLAALAQKLTFKN